MKKIFTTLVFVAIGATVSGQNLLKNPGFETDLEGWTKGPTSTYTLPTVVTTEFHTGTKSASYSGAAATTGFYQNVPVTAGKTYVISFWYKSAGDGSDTRLWSTFKDGSGTAVYTTAKAEDDSFRTKNAYLPNASEWTQYVAEMPAGAGAVSLDVAVRAYSGATLALFDDFLAADKATLAVTDVKEFDKQVKMNTVVDNELTLRLPERSTVNIYSVDGKLISSSRVSDGGSVNTAGIAKGNYIVTIDNGSTKVSRKIIKK